jgi:2-polyprenyl-3-methyl-5-hydroxy-6-metoxy-1,4-benzoquinol methylase
MLLSEHELSVAELTQITELAQSRVSTHLGKLRDAEVVRDRREGPSTFYKLNASAMPEETRHVLDLIVRDVRDKALVRDRERCALVLRAREAQRPWPDAIAGEMERHYSPGRTWEATARAFIGLMHLGDVLDAGAGDGTIAQLLAPRARSVTCIDRSEPLIDAARTRLASFANVKVCHGDLHELPFDSHRFDQVLLFNVLASVQQPLRVLTELARVLRPSGSICIVTLDAHSHLEITASYQHVRPGFSPLELRKLLCRAGLAPEHCDIVSREKRPPHFQVITAFARKP